MSVISIPVFLAGMVFIFEPNFEGLYGYTENNTLGRLLGWIMVMAALLVFALVTRLSLDVRQKTLCLDFAVIGLALIAIVSGLIGSSMGITPGIFKTTSIRDTDMRILEGVYAFVGVVLLTFYAVNRSSIARFLFEHDSDS